MQHGNEDGRIEGGGPERQGQTVHKELVLDWKHDRAFLAKW